MTSSRRGVRRASAVLALAPAVVPATGVLAAALPHALPAQQPAATGVITGRVTERGTNAPVAAAQVFVVGTTRSAITGDNGSFRITGVPAGTALVRVRRLGYSLVSQPANVTAGGSVALGFTLDRAQAQALTEVVVTATGAQAEARAIGNQVSRITPDNQPLPAITTGSQLLEGKSAGVVITQSGGASGSGARVRIRGGNSLSGSNEPLLIIDGVRINNDPNSSSLDVGGQSPSRINDLKAEDIESIEILKGPAATGLYGTQAANGVIQVTTKRGARGRTQYNAFAEGGAISNPYSFPANYQGFGANSASAAAATGSPVNRQCTLNAVAQGACLGQDSVRSFSPLDDPRTTPFRTGNRQRYGLSASGGGDFAQYYLSGDYANEKGIYQSSGLRNVNLRSNATARLRSNLDVTANLGYLNLHNPRPQNDNNSYGLVSGGYLGKSRYSPVDEGYLLRGPDTLNLISTIQSGDRLTGAGTLTYRPLSWLTVVGQGGLDVFNRDDQQLLPYGVFNPTLFGQDAATGWRFRNKYRIATYTANGSAAAARTLPHDVTTTTTVGIQYQRERTDGTEAYGYNILPGTGSLSTTNSRFAVAEFAPETRLFGALASEQIGWRDRVFLNGSIRGDNNSAFGNNTGFVTYPSVNGSYVISDEGFFPKSDLLNSLRLRAAIGKSGQRPQQLAALRFYAPVAVTVAGTDVPGFTVGNVGNQNLRPEVTTEGEVGLDVTGLRQRVDLQLTYFGRRTRDQLVLVPIAPSVGTGPNEGGPSSSPYQQSAQYQNVGTVTNKGFEALLVTRFIQARTFNFEMTWNFATLANHVLTLRDTTPILLGLGGASQRHQVGYPAGAYFLPSYTYRDANGDGTIQASEVTPGASQYIGNPLPKRTLSLQPVFTFGPNNLVRLQALVDYRGGWYQYNATAAFRCGQFLNCQDVYRKGTPLADQARAVAAYYYGTDYGYVEKGDFVKLREVSLSARLPRALLFGRAREGSITVAGRNLALLTNYSGIDPEANGGGQRNWDQYDFLSQPPARLFSVRLSYNY